MQTSFSLSVPVDTATQHHFSAFWLRRLAILQCKNIANIAIYLINIKRVLSILWFWFWFGLVWFGLMLKVLVNNFSVMLGWSHRFLCIASTFGGVNSK